MRLQPLQQWICDTCEQTIEKPEDGSVEWTRDKQGRVLGFRICHHATASPIRAQHAAPRGPSCYLDNRAPRADLSLVEMIGSQGMARMLMFVDVGEIHDPEAERLFRVADARSWAETFRRLFAPYYEEARLYFDAAKADGIFGDVNEVWPYLDSTLRRIIADYGNE